MNFILSVVF